ncbi:hypothetical protein GIB67_038339 [Kingdonia uniflora]|uniref:Uncharacterized protein n=1 Tax=Kingdonia uniflora TaxID=39325 RepID=A0A7J7KUN5_9MAGN|nr:hypothetical protein GIB67_038339 [Kingdonia uniflora]
MAVNPQLFPNGMPVPFQNEMFVLARDGVDFEIDKIPDGTHGGYVKTKGIIYLSNIRMLFVSNKPVGTFTSFDIPLIGVMHASRHAINRCAMPDVFDLLLALPTSLMTPPVLVTTPFVGICDCIAMSLAHIVDDSCRSLLSNETDVTMLKCPGNSRSIDDLSGVGTSLYVREEKFKQPIFLCNNISGLVEPVVPEDAHRALYSTHSFKILFKEGGCGTFVPLFFNLIASVRQYSQLSAYAAPEPTTRVDPLQAAQTPVDEMMRHAYVDPNDPTRIFLQQPTSESQLRRRTYQSHPAEHSI